MLTLSNYQIQELIQDSTKTAIYRGRRNQDSKPVIVKVLKAEYPDLRDIARIKHEYELTKDLDIKGIIKACCIEKHNNGLALILEDFNGMFLNEIIKIHKICLIDFLRIAAQVVQILGELNRHKVIHKNIKPQNIIINWEKQQIKIMDFSISSLLSRENPEINNPDLLEGTLAYMSPEQTGRMNRSIDYRTDFYSLGVTFYEMLTGRLPFDIDEPIELVHCHIAKQPIPPDKVQATSSSVGSGVPPVISNIVMKLLSKTAEDRYQSTFGLRADLENCLSQLETSGKISDFPPGQQDQSSQLQIPQNLYGREAEVAIMMAAFEQISQGTTEMLLITGYSGIGKSALVNEIRVPVVRKRGYFITGKFDQFKRNIPYASLIQAFQELIRQLLTENEAQLAIWQEKLLAVLYPNGQIIVDVIPEVELIIGKQPVVPHLGASESQNRFNLVFQEFISVFTSKTHPLVLFLDDLQWADSASLKLIRLLVEDPNSRYLLMIGAYRDNEVDANHPLMLTLEEIKKSNLTVKRINLQPLAVANVTQLVTDTLRREIEKTRLLAKLLFNKTAGNPFFLIQMLRFLYQEKLLLFDFDLGYWQWEIKQIQAIEITDNVAELMVDKIQKLPQNTQNILKLAACIGNYFDLNVLAVVLEKSCKTTAEELWEALQSGLILPLNDTYKLVQLMDQFDDLVVRYKFLHDRVQQAAYALIPDEQKKEVHLKVGQLLLKKIHVNRDSLEEHIFDIVNHINIGAELITNQTEREELAQLNLTAGCKAKVSTAYESAVKYLNLGLKLLGNNSWLNQYELTLALYTETVEAEYLSTNFK
ncbi:MAG: serine/threonine-protein kinase PknK, partial [Chroococcidiopsidaceae cyanobacterium CP_BM_RX_35]|nr:serine/threonine-protein kinase PknK [Chroococcidiopsidaceae cyanobacterium CP_BM_RX_35]